MQLKPGVKVSRIKPELLMGLLLAEKVYQDYQYAFVVTSINDSVHGAGSLHGYGYAADLRISHIKPTQWKSIHGALVRALGGEFDVILESDHFHIEFDLKRAGRLSEIHPVTDRANAA